MSNEPIPLREALREAVDELCGLYSYALEMAGPDDEALTQEVAKRNRVKTLIAQIPAEARVNDAK